ncbi:aldo/keto reductase [Hyunsoonleella sp. SJ7]|uniref:Aldo/keto reductase n=1 Tax=Hyunsoonleella aquatilis TaxID=2762758 RepID=A0A923HEN8_9FLAO|nr:aldo/keto reductase [Hyunsoonleella aquatilis]MBC3757082.1 aldo/keto reductase [Hyunsoonleella aquatilis]
MGNNTTKIGLGLAALGRPEYINIRENKSLDKSEKAFKENTFSVLDEAYNLGISYFDTAPSYGKGEAFLQEWNASRNHQNVILGTKWGYTYMANWELGFDGKHEVKEHSLEKLTEQWDVSKQLLPRLKYYQVHSATFESGILENQAVLNQLHHIKRTTNLKIGITASGANQKEIVSAALKIKVENEPLFDSFQVTYNVFEQDAFRILNTVLSQGKSVIVKEALANGRVFPNENFGHYKYSYAVLNELSEKYGVGIDALALRFVMDSLKPTYVLSGASNKKQLKENVKANDFSFSKNELEVLGNQRIAPELYWKERDLLAWN